MVYLDLKFGSKLGKYSIHRASVFFLIYILSEENDTNFEEYPPGN